MSDSRCPDSIPSAVPSSAVNVVASGAAGAAPGGAPSAVPGGLSSEVRRRHAWQLVGVSASVLAVLTTIDLFNDERAGTLGLGRLGGELATNAVIMLAVVLGMLGLRRVGVRWAQPSPAIGFDRQQRRAAARALRPGGEVDAAHRASIVAVARNLRRYRWAPAFFLVVGLVNGYSYATETGAGRWFYGLCALIGFGFTAYYVVALRRARAILSSEPGPGPAAEPGFGPAAEPGSGPAAGATSEPPA